MNRTHCYIPIDKELVTKCICMFATYTDIKGEKKMDNTNFIPLDKTLITDENYYNICNPYIDRETKDKLHYFDILIHLDSLNKINHLLDI